MGRRRKRPAKVHADKGYDIPLLPFRLKPASHPRCASRVRGIDILVRRLGRHRWVVDGMLAWLNRFRRLTVRYERRADIHQAVPYPRLLPGLLQGPLMTGFVRSSKQLHWHTPAPPAIPG